MATMKHTHTKGDLETQVGLLSVLARGCKTHRSYRAIRPPIQCGYCKMLYSVAQTLRIVKVQV